MADYPSVRLASIKLGRAQNTVGPNTMADVEFVIERTPRGDRDVSILILVDAEPEEEIVRKARATLADVFHEISLQTEAWRA